MRSRCPSLVVVLLCCSIGAVGCATASRQTWTKPGSSPQDLARDRYACIQESRIPWGQSYGGFGASGGGFGSGVSTAQGGSDGGFVFLGVHRRAQSEANRLFDACMEARAWQ